MPNRPVTYVLVQTPGAAHLHPVTNRQEHAALKKRLPEDARIQVLAQWKRR